MTEGVAQCRGVTAADTYHAEGVVGGEEEEEKEEEGKRWMAELSRGYVDCWTLWW